MSVKCVAFQVAWRGTIFNRLFIFHDSQRESNLKINVTCSCIYVETDVKAFPSEPFLGTFGNPIYRTIFSKFAIRKC